MTSNSSLPATRRAAQVVVACASLIPAVARADDGNWLLLGIIVLVVPTILFLVVAFAVTWFAVPPRARPLVMALCAAPCAPIYNGTFPWPLWTYYSTDGFIPTTSLGVAWRVLLTALTAYLVVQLIVWLRYRGKVPARPHRRTT